MHLLLNDIEDADERASLAGVSPIRVSPAGGSLAKVYANYRRLQLEAALDGNILESAQYAGLARSVDALQNVPARYGWEAN